MNPTPRSSPTRGGERAPEAADREEIGGGATCSEAGETSLAPTTGKQISQPARASSGYAEYPRGPLWDALREVADPEMGISLVDMGLVVAVQLVGDVAQVTLTYTAMGCPAMQMIEDDVRERLLRVPGVRAVKTETVWVPVWTKARLTEQGRDELLLNGLAL